MTMSRWKNLWMVAMLAVALTGALMPAWAQDNSTDAPPQQPQEPVPAYGQENAPPPVSENPPLSGLDLPNLEPHGSPISYIQPGATFSESADSNASNGLGGSQWSSISRGIGSVTLQRLWSHYDLAADYMGGIGYYDIAGQGLKSLQQGDIDQKISWRRGELSLRDSFSYLPEGNFGGAYGSEGSQGIASLGNTAFGQFWGGAGLGTLGLDPRLVNIALADVSENLTPKSAVTAAGGYALTHFYGNSDPGVPFPMIGTSQYSGQLGYDRILTSHTQIALVYGYQGFDFSIFGESFHSHVIQLMYGHRISGRMDLLIAAGPQYTLIGSPCTIADALEGNPHCTLDTTTLGVTGTIPDQRWGVAGQFRLRYKFPRTNFDLWYQRFETSGSGIFFGAQTDLARLSAERTLTRVWDAFADMGYARNSRLEALTPAESSTCGGSGQPICPGANGNIYSYAFAGGGLHRAIGHSWHAFASYQFNELWFDHSYCGGSGVCARISNRSVFTLGLDWTPRPIRID
jgi:hypothetical protein